MGTKELLSGIPHKQTTEIFNIDSYSSLRETIMYNLF